jgi:hypothetical protein
MSEPHTFLFALSALRELRHFFSNHFSRDKNNDRDEILRNIKALESFYSLEEDRREQFRDHVLNTEVVIDKWLRNPIHRSLHVNEAYIFGKIKSILREIKQQLNRDCLWDSKKARLNLLLLCCNLLESRYEFIYHNRPGQLNEPLHERSTVKFGSQLKKKPTYAYYILLAVMPLALLVFFKSPKRHSMYKFILSLANLPSQQSSQSSKPPIDESKCPPTREQSKYEDSLRKRLIGDIEDDGFVEILSKSELREILKESPETTSRKTSPENGKRLSESDLLDLIIRYQKRNRDTILSNKLDRIKPLLHIFSNNKKARSLEPNSYMIAVAVPFDPLYREGPSPWGVGILRGADIAQKYILDKRQKVPFQVVVVNDYFDDSILERHPTPQDLSHYLSTDGYKGRKVIALIGHQQEAIARLTSICYEEYEMPTLLSLFLSSSYQTKSYIQSLLLSNADMVRKIIEASDSRPASTKKSLVVFFDKNDGVSQETSRQTCTLINDTQISKQYNSCEEIDVSHEKFSQDIISDEKISTSDWLLAFNPYENQESSHSFISDKVKYIIKAHTANNKKGDIFVNHNFVDEMFVRELEGSRRESSGNSTSA